MIEYNGYKYQENENGTWEVLYPTDDTKPWVVGFETEAKTKAWIDEKIAGDEAQENLEDRVTTLEADNIQTESDIDVLENAVIEMAQDIVDLQGGSL